MSIVPWLGQEFLAKNDAAAFFARRDAVRVQQFLRRDGDQPRFAVGERLTRRLQHRGARAAAADPAFRDRAVGAISALAPALAAVTETVRTTVASAKASPLAWRLRRQFENVERSCQILAR